MSDAEFALIEPLLPAAKRGGRRRSIALREVVNVILYLLRSGCPWYLAAASGLIAARGLRTRPRPGS